MLWTDPDNWKYITSVKSISGRKKTILSILVLCGINILEKSAEENEFDKNILLATSPTNYFNDELTL